MSEETEPKIPNNEQVIDDLTENLRDAQLHVESPETNRVTDFQDENPNIPSEFDASDSEEKETPQETNDSDDSDGDGETQEDSNLTEEQKEDNRRQALKLKNLGNDEFKNDNYQRALEIYTEALQICPLNSGNERSVLFANRSAAKVKLGQKKSAIRDCTKALKLNDRYVRAYLRRAKLYEETEKLDESLEDYKQVLVLDPGNVDALQANQRLPGLISERNEKMKTEMFDKLKDLGNLFLRPFGLSTDNFKLQQDPNSGGYSVNFQQNPSN